MHWIWNRGIGCRTRISASGAITDSGVVTVAGTTSFDNSGGRRWRSIPAHRALTPEMLPLPRVRGAM